MKRTRIGGEDATAVSRAAAIVAQGQPKPGDHLPGTGPLARAALRVEAEMLLADAAVWSATADSTASGDERRRRAVRSVIDRLDRLGPLPLVPVD